MTPYSIQVKFNTITQTIILFGHSRSDVIKFVRTVYRRALPHVVSARKLNPKDNTQ